MYPRLRQWAMGLGVTILVLWSPGGATRVAGACGDENADSAVLTVIGLEATEPGEAPFDRYDVRAWTTREGLPQNSVTSIVQTRDGYLWLATFGGLARFDGVRFKIFDLANTEAFTSNRLLSLLEDRSGNLWIGTMGNGVVRLRDGVFTSFRGEANAPRGEVWSIAEDRDGAVWFGAHNLVRYTDGRFEAAGPDEWMTRNRQSWSLFVDREQSLWVATSNGLGRFRDGQWRVFRVADGLPANDVRFVNEDPSGRLWAGRINGLCHFDGDRFVESQVDGEEPSWIFAAAVDGRGNYWVGSGKGVFLSRAVSEVGDGTSARILFQRAVERSVAGGVRALLEDREGNIWVGTDGDGLLCIRPAAFKPFTPPSGLIVDSGVRSLVSDGSGGLWIQFNKGKIVHIKDDAWEELPANDDIGPIRSIKCGGDGTLWIRHQKRKMLSKYRDGHFTHLEQELDQIRGFFVDRGGTAWILSRGRLSMIPDGQTKPITVIDGLPHMGGGSVADSRDGTIWIGGHIAGLVGCRDGEFRHYTVADGFPRATVRSIHEGSDGNLWIATYGGGLDSSAGSRVLLRGHGRKRRPSTHRTSTGSGIGGCAARQAGPSGEETAQLIRVGHGQQSQRDSILIVQLPLESPLILSLRSPTTSYEKGWPCRSYTYALPSWRIRRT